MGDTEVRLCSMFTVGERCKMYTDNCNRVQVFISRREVQVDCYIILEEGMSTSGLGSQGRACGGVVFELNFKGWIRLLMWTEHSRW